MNKVKFEETDAEYIATLENLYVYDEETGEYICAADVDEGSYEMSRRDGDYYYDDGAEYHIDYSAKQALKEIEDRIFEAENE